MEYAYDRNPGRRGRPSRLSADQVSAAYALYYNEGMSVREVADELRVSHMTVWRALVKSPEPPSWPDVPQRYRQAGIMPFVGMARA